MSFKPWGRHVDLRKLSNVASHRWDDDVHGLLHGTLAFQQASYQSSRQGSRRDSCLQEAVEQRELVAWDNCSALKLEQLKQLIRRTLSSKMRRHSFEGGELVDHGALSDAG